MIANDSPIPFDGGYPRTLPNAPPSIHFCSPLNEGVLILANVREYTQADSFAAPSLKQEKIR